MAKRIGCSCPHLGLSFISSIPSARSCCTCSAGIIRISDKKPTRAALRVGRISALIVKHHSSHIQIIWYTTKYNGIWSPYPLFPLIGSRVDGMIEKRGHRRIDCATKCILYHEGSKFRGVVENLSVSGALVRIRRNLSESIHPGDACSLLICHLPALSYSRHSSQVKHIDSTTVGIKFLFLEDGTTTQFDPLTRKLFNIYSDTTATECESARSSTEVK
jgi:PilZ domain